jgi:trigger factor
MTDSAPESAAKFDVHEEPAWRRVIDVEIGADEVAAAYTKAYKDYQKHAKVPGFRPGKVPRTIVAQRFGPQVQREVLNALIPAALAEAYRQHHLRPITNPELSDVYLKEGEPFRFRAALEVKPDLDPKDYTGLVLEKKKHPITQDHVDQTIERIRERRAEYALSSEPARRGDVVVCDLEETTPGRADGDRQMMSDVSLDLHPERIMPEFADGLLGVRAGESRSIAVTYPDDHGNKGLAGRKVEFRISVKEVKLRKLPELTTEFFSKLSGDIKSLEDLRALVTADLEAQVEQEAIRALNSEIITQVLAKNPFELPPSLMIDYLARLTEDLKQRQPDITPEQVESQYRELGVRQVRWEFLYHAIADKEGVTVSDEDLNAWLGRFAETQGIDIEEARRQLAGADQVARIRDNILENKVLSFLRERSTITELPLAGNLIATPGEGRRL